MGGRRPRRDQRHPRRDSVAIFLFWSRGLPYTSGLYALFLLLSIAGLIGWRRALASRPAA